MTTITHSTVWLFKLPGKDWFCLELVRPNGETTEAFAGPGADFVDWMAAHSHATKGELSNLVNGAPEQGGTYSLGECDVMWD